MKNQVTETLQDWHDTSEEHPEASDAIVLGTAIGAWYAMPDVIRSRALRFLAKLGILAAAGSYYYHLPDVPQAVQELPEDAAKKWQESPLGKQPLAVQLAAGAGVIVAGIALNSATERAIFRRGEKRRAKGKKAPHLRQGLILGALAGGIRYLQLREN